MNIDDRSYLPSGTALNSIPHLQRYCFINSLHENAWYRFSKWILTCLNCIWFPPNEYATPASAQNSKSQTAPEFWYMPKLSNKFNAAPLSSTFVIQMNMKHMAEALGCSFKKQSGQYKGLEMQFSCRWSKGNQKLYGNTLWRAPRGQPSYIHRDIIKILIAFTLSAWGIDAWVHLTYQTTASSVAFCIIN